MEGLLIALGLALAALAVWDAALTVLHPARRGPLSTRVNRIGWRLLRTASRGLGSRRLMTAAGPLAMATHFVAWVGGVWVGCALVYAARIDDFEFQRSAAFGSTGWAEAFYVSGSALTTVGFGDVVASTDWLRILMVLEAAAGLALFTCAVTYVLGVYPIVVRFGASARRIQDFAADSVGGASQLVADGGRAEVAQLHRELIAMQENVRRFPVLSYFRPRHGLSYPLALVRAGAVAELILSHAPPPATADWAATYGRAMGRALAQIRHDFVAEGFIGEPHLIVSDEEAVAARERLRGAVAAALGEPPAGTDAGAAEMARDLGRLQGLVDALAVAHGYPAHALLAGAAAGPGGSSGAARAGR